MITQSQINSDISVLEEETKQLALRTANLLKKVQSGNYSATEVNLELMSIQTRSAEIQEMVDQRMGHLQTMMESIISSELNSTGSTYFH